MSGFDEMADLKKMLEAQEFEKALSPAETQATRAQRIIEEGATVAAMSIVQLSRSSANENLRFRAATYILDRVLGDVKSAGGSKPFEDLLAGVTIPDDASSLSQEA